VFETGDIFGSLIPSQYDSQFDVIRASNILNLSYFSPDQIIRALTNIRGHLNDQGLLVVNRTSDSTNHFTIFRREGSQFSVLHQGNEGSEIADLVLGLGKRDSPRGD
jgi:chemotaxis methyl-accepting protein methylase